MKNLFQTVKSTIKTPLFRREESQPHKLRNSLNSASKVIDTAPGFIVSASRALADAIQEILSDSASLSSEDIPGFFRLLELLESDDNDAITMVDQNVIISGGGMRCMSILLRYLYHEDFCDLCYDASLALALIHALRLLRMLEVKCLSKDFAMKLSKNGKNNDQNMEGILSKPVTFIASERVCKVLSVLCCHTKTLEQLRDYLVKLLCIPLSILPCSGIHIQKHVSSVISSICSSTNARPALSASLIWYLHDSQLMFHVNRALKELISIPAEPYRPAIDNAIESASIFPKDGLMRGLAAERAEMWLEACSCLVNLLLASLVFSTTLLTDFEANGGYDTIVQVFLHTSPQRSMRLMTIVARLLNGDHKGPEQQITHPEISKLFYMLISALLGVNNVLVQFEDDIMTLIQLCDEITEASTEWRNYEFLLQNLSYAMLTSYSEHPYNYALLERSYQLLPVLMLCLPGFSAAESCSAVFKLIHFLCFCLDKPPITPLTALCASVTVMVRMTHKFRAHSGASEDASECVIGKSYESWEVNLRLAVGALEEIVKGDRKFALILINCGLLEHVICGPLEALDSMCSGAGAGAGAGGGSKALMPPSFTYEMLLSIATTLVTDNPEVVSAVRSSSLIRVVRSLISSDNVSSVLVRCSMALLQQFVKADGAIIEENLRTIMDLLRVVLNRPAKAKHVLDSISGLLAHDLRVPAAWIAVSGFEAVLSVIGSMENLFTTHSRAEGAGSYDLELDFECLTAAIRCLSAALHSSSTSSYLSSNTQISNRQYFKERNLYTYLTHAILQTNVLRSAFASLFIEELFHLLGGSRNISNPESAEVIINILPYAESDLAVNVLKNLNNMALSQRDGRRVLCLAGMSAHLMEAHSEILFDMKSPLRVPLHALLLDICKNYVTHRDFVAMIRCLLRPLVLTSETSERLLPPWQTMDKKAAASRSWGAVELLVDVAECSYINANGAPYVLLGAASQSKAKDGDDVEEESEGQEPAYVNFTWVENQQGKPFPTSFSFSCWMRVEERSQESPGRGNAVLVLPIFSLSSSAAGVLLEARIQMSTNTVRVFARKGRHISAIDFDVPNVNDGEWHLFGLTFHRSMRFGLSKALLTLFIDAEKIAAEKIDCDIPAQQNQAIEVKIGKSLMDFSDTMIDVSQKAGSDQVELGGLWYLGPTLLFEDVLNQNQVSFIWMLGKSYTGSFQGDFPLSPPIAAASSYVLCRCNRKFTDIPALLQSLGLSGLDLVVSPPVEAVGDAVGSFEAPQMPQPVLVFSVEEAALCALNAQDSSEESNSPTSAGGKKRVMKEDRCPTTEGLILFNCASGLPDKSGAAAVVVNGWYASNIQTIPICVASSGGPQILLPLLQSASTEQHILLFLRLLKVCVRYEPINLRYMLASGYQMISFLLSTKPKDIVTEQVMKALFDMATDYGFVGGNVTSVTSGSNFFHCLLVDTHALYSLVLNHRVWDCRRFEFASAVVSFLKSLVDEDCRHNITNARRLSMLGVPRWMLMLIASGVDRIGSTGLNTGNKSDSSSTWSVKSCTVDDAAYGTDTMDAFFGTVFRVLGCIMLSELRQKDLTTAANIVISTLSSQCYNSGGSAAKGTKPTSPATELTVQELLRVYIIRFALDIYSCFDPTEGRRGAILASSPQNRKVAHSSWVGSWRPLLEAELIHIFNKSFRPGWFITVLEYSSEYATTSLCLRLLVSFLQKDGVFLREFCSPENFKVLFNILTSRWQPIPVILPLIALLFQIPMQSIPLPNEVNTLMLLDLIAPAIGPIVSDMDILLACYLPTFSLLVSVFASNAKLRSKAESCDTNDLIISVIFHGSERNEPFRQLMQQRPALEALTNAMAVLSDPVIAPTINDDIVNCEADKTTLPSDDTTTPTAITKTSKSILDLLEDESNPGIGATTHRLDLNLVEPEGQQLTDVVSKVIYRAIFEFKNIQILSHLLVDLPKQVAESSMVDFQRHVFDCASVYIKKAFEEMTFESMMTIAQMLTCLVTLGKAGLIMDDVLLDILKSTLFALRHLSNSKAINTLGHDKHSILLKDFVTTGRYFSILCIHVQLSSKEIGSNIKLLHILQIIRSNLNMLYPSLLEETLEVSSSRGKKDTEDKIFNLPALDSFHIGWHDVSVTRRVAIFSDSLYNQLQAEKFRLSQVFTLFLFNAAYNLLMCETQPLRMESMRICACLLLYRRSYLDDLLDTSPPTQHMPSLLTRRDAVTEDAETAEAALIEGFSMLLPGLTAQYAKSLQVPSCNFEGEDVRQAEFSYWLVNNGHRCVPIFQAIESNLSTLLPMQAAVTNVIKSQQSQRTRFEDVSGAKSYAQVAAQKRMEELTRVAYKVNNHIKVWMTYGMADTVTGALLWRNVWKCLQSGPLWGPKWSHDISRQFLSDAMLRVSVRDIPACKLPLRLSGLEGPERARILLELDCDAHDLAYGGEENSAAGGDDVSIQANVNNSADAQDIEEFLKQFADRGILSVAGNETDDGGAMGADVDTDGITAETSANTLIEDEDKDGIDEADDGNESPMRYAGPEVQSSVDFLDARRSGSDSFDEFTSEDRKNLSGGARAGMSPGRPNSTMDDSSEDEDEDEDESQTSERSEEENQKRIDNQVQDMVSFRRGKLLLELAKAIIAPEDWSSGSSLSVQR